MVIDCDDRTTSSYMPSVAQEKFAPCSTFKIWNTLIGLDNGIISAADEPFYTWDGEKRFIPDWNKNLNLKQAFQVSCVPRLSGTGPQDRTRAHASGSRCHQLRDRNISAGIDVFWLPEPGRKTILISPLEQAELIGKLATGKLSFAQKSQDVLREIMTARTTLRGTLFGKTGTSGNNITGSPIGWYVGYIETNRKNLRLRLPSQGKRCDGQGRAGHRGSRGGEGRLAVSRPEHANIRWDFSGWRSTVSV